MPTDPRDAAARLLSRHAGRFPDLEPLPVEDQALEPRDAALAHAIADAAVRRWLTLGFVLGLYLDRPFAELEPRMQGVLLAGAAQLLLLDKIPPHAAINEAVEWAKRHIRPGAGGMTNAILRKVGALRLRPGEGEDASIGRRERWTDRRDEVLMPDGTAVVLGAEVLPEDNLERLSVQASLPVETLRAWAEQFGIPQARELALHSLSSPPVILNVAHATGELPEGLGTHEAEGARVFLGGHAELRTLLDARPDVWVQDPASTEAVRSVRDLAPKLIVDACAGQGTKTRQLAATFPEARIVAADVDEGRLRTLRRAFEGHPRVEVRRTDELIPDLAGQADLVLLDVPCSNSGVLARRPEARYRLATGQGGRLRNLQRQIVADAIPLLSEGGRILYSTCSLEREENEGIAEWAAEWHRFRRARERRTMPAGTPGEPASGYRDGSYSVVLER